MTGGEDDYSRVRGVGRVKLKETPQERAARLFNKEQKRQARMTARIARANGFDEGRYFDTADKRRGSREGKDHGNHMNHKDDDGVDLNPFRRDRINRSRSNDTASFDRYDSAPEVENVSSVENSEREEVWVDDSDDDGGYAVLGSSQPVTRDKERKASTATATDTSKASKGSAGQSHTFRTRNGSVDSVHTVLSVNSSTSSSSNDAGPSTYSQSPTPVSLHSDRPDTDRHRSSSPIFVSEVPAPAARTQKRRTRSPLSARPTSHPRHRSPTPTPDPLDTLDSRDSDPTKRSFFSDHSGPSRSQVFPNLARLDNAGPSRTTPDVHIPRRFVNVSGQRSSSNADSSTRTGFGAHGVRGASTGQPSSAELGNGSNVPGPSHMSELLHSIANNIPPPTAHRTDAEYTAYLRQGFAYTAAQRDRAVMEELARERQREAYARVKMERERERIRDADRMREAEREWEKRRKKREKEYREAREEMEEMRRKAREGIEEARRRAMGGDRGGAGWSGFGGWGSWAGFQGTGGGMGGMGGTGVGGNATHSSNPPAAQNDWKKAQRERYGKRWAALRRGMDEKDDTTASKVPASSSAATVKEDKPDSEEVGLEEVELGFSDIPWPVYSSSAPSRGERVTIADIDKERIKAFILDLARDARQGGDVKTKTVIREAIRSFHPDRFHSRILPRVREGEREKVKEGGEACVRVLTGVMGEV